MRQLLRDSRLSDFLWRMDISRLALNTLERIGQPKIYHDIKEDWIKTSPFLSRLAEVANQQPLHDQHALIATGLHQITTRKLDAMWALNLRCLGYKVSVVENMQRYSYWTIRYLKAAGVNDFFDLVSFAAKVPESQLPSHFKELIKSSMWEMQALLHLTYKGVDVGRIALSNLLNRYKYRNFNLESENSRKEIVNELARIQRTVIAAENLINLSRPNLIVMMEKGLSPGAELFGIAVDRDIPVIQYTSSQNPSDFILRRYTFENRHQHPFSLSSDSWEKIQHASWNAEIEQELMEDFKESYSTGKWFNRKFLHADKQFKSIKEVREQIGLDPQKKTAVVFSHVLWDATFFYGEGLFDDYETWLIETVRAASKNPNVNWVIKLHPDLTWKLDLEEGQGEIRDTAIIEAAIGSQLPDHVHLVMPNTDISTYSFFGITNYCLTVRGTIGIEMACHGVPVLTAGTGRYSGLGFTNDSSTVEEYLNKLSNIENLPEMTPEEIQLARRFAHALFKLRPWPLRSIEVLAGQRSQVGHPLEPRLKINIEDPEAFFSAADLCGLRDWVRSEKIDFLLDT